VRWDERSAASAREILIPGMRVSKQRWHSLES
jgi:hypothetical protein